MKILINMLLLTVIHLSAFSQITDTLPLSRDRNNVPTEELPVLKDTIQVNDTVVKKTAEGSDTTVKKRVHSPRKATIYSAILPGLGQVYNKKYWKVPLVYGAVGFPAYLFFFNKKYYNASRFALQVIANDVIDPVQLAKVDPDLQEAVRRKATGSLLNWRNEYRRNMDYSVLFTLLMWGLNVVDATVDGHLKGFDVSDDLALKINPAIIPGTMVPGVSFVLNFK